MQDLKRKIQCYSGMIYPQKGKEQLNRALESCCQKTLSCYILNYSIYATDCDMNARPLRTCQLTNHGFDIA